MVAFTNKEVMELRKLTNVGVMDCRAALEQANGDMTKAQEILRQKGMASAEKRANKIASQGLVDSYIHMNGNVGVLLEVNCETDFVARSDQFKSFVHDIALHIAAAAPKYVEVSEVPADFIAKEKEIALAQAENAGKGKPENVLQKIADGKVNKVLKEICLLDQDFVKDPTKKVKDVLNEIVAAIGEKISIRRFVRYEMGEGLEKKDTDNLAAEVEEQIAKMKK